jgi:hypothetical protein
LQRLRLFARTGAPSIQIAAIAGQAAAAPVLQACTGLQRSAPFLLFDFAE